MAILFRVVILLVLNLSAISSGLADETPTSFERMTAPPILKDGKILKKREAVICPRGSCLVIKEAQDTKSAPLFPGDRKILNGLNELSEDDVEIPADDEKNPWFPGEKGNGLFNCHSFSLGSLVGLNTSDWVPGDVEDRDEPNPVQVLLDSFFVRIEEIPFEKITPKNVKETAGRDLFHEKDVIMFTNTAAKTTKYIHSGQLHKHKGSWWVYNKLGRGPLVLSTMNSLVHLFALFGQKDSNLLFNSIEFYRYKKP